MPSHRSIQGDPSRLFVGRMTQNKDSQLGVLFWILAGFLAEDFSLCKNSSKIGSRKSEAILTGSGLTRART